MVSATAIIPITVFLSAKYNTVFPCFNSSSLCKAILLVSILFSFINNIFPPKYSTSSISPLTPLPEIAINPVTSNNSIDSSFTFSKTASANGCSEFFSKLPTIFRNSFCGKLETISVTFGFPSVMVPVLSNTTVSTKCNRSRLSADFINIPFSAPFPVPTIIATGVANPNAHGHDMTRTAIPMVKASSKL